MFSFHTVALQQQEGRSRLGFLLEPLAKDLFCLLQAKARTKQSHHREGESLEPEKHSAAGAANRQAGLAPFEDAGGFPPKI
jgi:hypothetical protein